MAAMDRLRAWVRVWLGLDAVATTQHVRALEATAKQRHGEVLEILNRIEKRMIAGHVDQPREFVPSVLDWDTVQAMALAALEREGQ